MKPLRLCSFENVEGLLRELQHELELRGTETTKVRRRAMLRGYRAASYAVTESTTLDEVRHVLRAELFGTGAPAPFEDEADDSCS